MPSVAVITPVYSFPLNTVEIYAIAHLRHYCGKYPRFFVHPDGLNIPDCYDDFARIGLPSGYFQSTKTYNRLCLSPALYEPFMQFEYVLLYQLDCLVFRDELAYWCKQGYDYIGAPWFKNITESRESAEVGNGGLSLRKVATFLDILHKGHMHRNIREVMRRPSRFANWPLLDYPARACRIFGRNNRADRHVAKWSRNEDHWWSFEARRFTERFIIPKAEVASRFSVEVDPKYWFEKNGRRLPFGCHAWYRWGRDFWTDHLLAIDQKLQ